MSREVKTHLLKLATTPGPESHTQLVITYCGKEAYTDEGLCSNEFMQEQGIMEAVAEDAMKKNNALVTCEHCKKYVYSK